MNTESKELNRYTGRLIRLDSKEGYLTLDVGAKPLNALELAAYGVEIDHDPENPSHFIFKLSDPYASVWQHCQKWVGGHVSISVNQEGLAASIFLDYWPEA